MEKDGSTFARHNNYTGSLLSDHQSYTPTNVSGSKGFWIQVCRYYPQSFQLVIIYKEMFLGCDWLIRVQLIQNITQNSAKSVTTVQKSVTTVQKSVTTVQKSVTTVQKSVTTVQKSVTTVQKSVISSLSDGIYSQKQKIWRPNFHGCLKISSKFQHNLGFFSDNYDHKTNFKVCWNFVHKIFSHGFYIL